MAIAYIIGATIEDSKRTLSVTATVDEGGNIGVKAYNATITLDAAFRALSPAQKLTTITQAIKAVRDADIIDQTGIVSVLIGREITV